MPISTKNMNDNGYFVSSDVEKQEWRSSFKCITSKLFSFPETKCLFKEIVNGNKK